MDALTLLFDVWLRASGRRTITAHVRERPALGVPLVAWQVLLAVALAAHLW